MKSTTTKLLLIDYYWNWLLVKVITTKYITTTDILDMALDFIQKKPLCFLLANLLANK